MFHIFLSVFLLHKYKIICTKHTLTVNDVLQSDMFTAQSNHKYSRDVFLVSGHILILIEITMKKFGVVFALTANNAKINKIPNSQFKSFGYKHITVSALR